MTEKITRTILALLLVVCPYLCGQGCTACAVEANALEVNTEIPPCCQAPCCPREGSSSDHDPSDSSCPCEAAGSCCICCGAVLEEDPVDEYRQPVIAPLLQTITTQAAEDVPTVARNATYVSESPPGQWATGRDVRTWCASFLL